MSQTDTNYVRPKDIDNRASWRQRAMWRLETIGWDVIYWTPMKLLGPERASNFGAWLTSKIGPRLSQHKTVLRNLRMAFPEWSDEKINDTARAAWENVGRTIGELPHLKALDPYASGRVEVVNVEGYDALQASDTGAVMISGHFANWEVMGASVVGRIPDSVMTYRALNNPYIDRRLNAARQSIGMTRTAPKGIGTRELMRALARGEPIGLMNDQKFREGIPVKFFGHDAMTAPGPTRLALRYKVPIVMVSTVRTGPARYRITVHEPFMPQDTGDLDADLHANVTRINQWIEGIIREHPDQWFWQHRRWPKEAWREAGVM